MAQQMNRLLDGVYDGNHIFELPLDGVLGGVAALAAPAAVKCICGEVFLEIRQNRSPTRRGTAGAVHQDERRPVAAALAAERRAISRHNGAQTHSLLPAKIGAPNCCITPKSSRWFHNSTTLPSSIRKILTPENLTRLPVAGSFPHCPVL